ncbi:MAG: hypothetical protein WC827_02755 [Candidatus Paceibacterota bacterium]|jgi:uncharacterized membrane protein
MENQEQQKEAPIKSTENQQNNNTQIDNDKMWAIVAYLIFFLPLLVVKNRSAFLNYHINQGIILFIVAFIGNIVFSMPFSYGILMLGQIWGLLVLILAIMGIVNVTRKEMKPLPLIGNLYKFIK